jgi:dinuclear metal center YbgI/SA1388 family protein
MARRDDIVAFADELLEVDAWPDFGPMGMQVVGAEAVERIACGVSASLELFERAAEAGAHLVLVHHGLFLHKRSQVIDLRARRRLEALFGADLTLLAYHLALDAHPEVGNNACLARALGVERELPFASIGLGGRLRGAEPLEAFLARVREHVTPDPLVFPFGKSEVGRVAISSGKSGYDLAQAAAEGYDLFLTGEPEEETVYVARELGIHFVAAGHYATERLGVQALAERLADRFGVAWEFVEVANPV